MASGAQQMIWEAGRMASAVQERCWLVEGLQGAVLMREYCDVDKENMLRRCSRPAI